MPQEQIRVEPIPELVTTNSESQSKKVPLWKIAIPALIILLVGIFGINYFATSNTDYICTRTVATEGTCTDGAWGGWATVNTTTNGDIQTVTQQRVYTGTRLLSRQVEYLNLRTNCAAGFDQQVHGSGGGNSGFHGGNVITTTQVCQIAQSRVMTHNVKTGEDVQTAPTTVISQTYGDTHEETVSINSFDDVGGVLLQARRDAVALDITAEPNLVAPNTTTSVHWTSVEMTHCLVTASTNADTWGSLTSVDATKLTGQENTRPIKEETTYTLKCLDFEGNPHEKTAKVRITPSFQEI